MKACLFGTHDRAHSANRLLATALHDIGFEIEELHEGLSEITSHKGPVFFGARSLAGFSPRYAGAVRRLGKRWKTRTGAPPLVIIGFGGQLDLVFARLICRPRRALIFAPLVSLTETLVEDRGYVAAESVRAHALAGLDRLTLRIADLVLCDSEAHAEYLRELGAPAERLVVWPLGVEREFLEATPRPPRARRVLFYGRYVRLHGVETIVAAAARLGPRAEFVLIGDGPERPSAERTARRLGARIEWRDEIPLAALPDELSAASVVLGVFGESRKAGMVIPNKVYQAAAMGRPLVTRDGPGLREVLEPGQALRGLPTG